MGATGPSGSPLPSADIGWIRIRIRGWKLRGFEPLTPCMPCRCSARLSYSPSKACSVPTARTRSETGWAPSFGSDAAPVRRSQGAPHPSQLGQEVPDVSGLQPVMQRPVGLRSGPGPQASATA